MNRRLKNLMTCGVATLALSMTGIAGQSAVRAETRLVGVNLYDPGSKLISMFGSPLEIQAVSLGGTSTGPVGGGGGGRGGAPGAGNPRGGGPGGKGDTSDFGIRGDIGFGDTFLQAGGDELRPNPNAPGGQNSGGPGRPGPGGAPGGGGGGAASSGDRIIFTRWVYKRANSKYGFILDKFNRVVQIEAIGLNDSRVKTRRGVGFGSSFGTLIKTYGAPDGYELNGDSLVVRFLLRHKVAFRLNRLGKDKPHRVTGVVVSAGKA